MEDRYLDKQFFNDFQSYQDCVPPGVRLPEIKIDESYYKEFGINSEKITNADFLRLICDKGLKDKEIYRKNNYKSYQDRLDYELNIIDDLGFTDYILLNWDILNFCHKNRIPTGPGRGSAAGSLILFLINVTKVDPIKYDLYFERFVSRSRAKKTVQDGVTFLDGGLLADVDNDIAYEHRQKVINYIESKYPNRTCKILTLNTLSGKLCIKECCKIVASFSEQDANLVSDYIPKEFGVVMKLEKARSHNDKFSNFCKNNLEVYEIAKTLEGLKKNSGVHPSGIAISYNVMSDLCPLQKTNDGSIVSSYDMHWISELTVKFDILGLRTLSAIYSSCALLNIKPEDIPLDSEKIYSNFSHLLHPHGIFQIEAGANFSVCKKIRPQNLEQLSAVIAIARPGAIDFADNYKDYVKSGSAQSINHFFDDVLDYTGGIPLYQEQLMKMAVKIGFNLDEAEQLRRIVGKKRVDKMKEWKDKISDKIKENNLDSSIGDSFWKVAEDSANYSFNKSHSISYSILSAWTAFIKFNHPKEFFLSLLKMTEYEPSPQDEIKKISQELPFFNIELLPPDLSKSQMDFSIEGNHIRYGLNSIKGINKKSLTSLRDFINSDNPNKFDTFLSAKTAGLNIGILSSLIQAGALSSNQTSRARLVLEAQVFNLLTDREKRIFYKLGDRYDFDILKAIDHAVKGNLIGDDNKPIMKPSRFETLKSKYKNYKTIYDKNKQYEDFANWFFETKLLGFSYSTTLGKCFGSSHKFSSSLDLLSYENGYKSKYIGVVEDSFSGKSRKNNDYLKLVISDELGSFNAILVDGRDKKLKKFKSRNTIPEKNNIVILTGSKGDDVIFIDDLSIIDEKIYMKLSDIK